MRQQKLVISQSKIRGAGLGLFACDSTNTRNVVFKKGVEVALYARRGATGSNQQIGEFMSDDKITRRYGNCLTAPYGVDHIKGRVVDTACQRSIASYANHSTKGNTEIQWNESDTELWLIATANIRNGDEITWNYGDNYIFELPKFFEYQTSHTRRATPKTRCRSSRRRRSRLPLPRKSPRRRK